MCSNLYKYYNMLKERNKSLFKSIIKWKEEELLVIFNKLTLSDIYDLYSKFKVNIIFN